MGSRCSSNERGQSTIEFILTFAFGVSFVLVIFNSAINYARGYLVHYATFMASRVYLTADENRSDPIISYNYAEELSKEAFAQYKLTALNIPDSAYQVNTAPTTENRHLLVGGHTSFELEIDVIGRVAGERKLQLVSESFLGKEPTRAACYAQVCKAITGSDTCDTSMDITLYDDGC